MKTIFVVPLLCFTLLLLAEGRQAAAGFTLASPDLTASVCVPVGEPECVRLAADDLVSDVRKITGRELAKRDDGNVLVVSMNRPDSAAMLEMIAPGFGEGLKGQWEAYRVETVGSRLIIAGSDERGTMFGLYAFIEEYLGVDPLYFWASRPPQKRDKLAWDHIELSSDGPTFRFRGWFINDEDLLTEWMESGGKRNIEYPFYGQVVNREAMRAVAEALVRSRFNLIIPASFVDIMNPPEEALVKECARRGVFVSQHHVEPLGVSAFSYFNYWKKRGRDLKYSYFSHPDEVREVWRAYAEKWATYPNVIWQLGLRGIADRPMWMADPNTPQSDADRGRLISDAMAAQVRILDEVCPRKPRYMTTTLWAEGSVLNAKGLLKIPENTTVVFSDNSPGWKWQQDFYSTPRNPKNTYGVYYHHGLIGSGPHLAQVPSPAKTFECLDAAVRNQTSEYVIFNVANIREFVLGIDASAKMTWRMKSFDPGAWLDKWVEERFSGQRAEIAAAYRLYFQTWRVHGERKVPFLMDGQMLVAGTGFLAAISSKLAEKSGKTMDVAQESGEHPPKHSSDAFWAGIDDMHPRNSRSEIIQGAAAQKEGFSRVLQQARTAASHLPENEAAFLRDNLIYQSAIMLRTSSWLEKAGLATAALEAHDLSACAQELSHAESEFAEIPALAAGYSSGQWENWYRGCRKLNITATLKQTREVLEQVRNFKTRH
jgi:hypothetical protein